MAAKADQAGLTMDQVNAFCRNAGTSEVSKMGPKNLKHLLGLLDEGKVYDPNDDVPL